MIVCKKCGTQNAEVDSFCGSCGAFLEWTGERVVTKPRPAAPEPEPDPEEESAPRRSCSRVSSRR